MFTYSPAIPLLLMVGVTVGPAVRSLPEARAVAFLSAEVPRWSRENHCFSCHNNGDAARALYQASRAGYRVAQAALTDTTHWLSRPADWKHNGGEGPQSDQRLARVAFAATLESAIATQWIKDRSVLARAADRLALDQDASGFWPIEGENTTGSPATYGRRLATLLARQALISADPRRFRAAIDRADVWLSSQEILTVTDASVCLMASAAVQPPAGTARRKHSLELLRRGQSDDGGWGPLAASPPEPFDTALALLALTNCEESPEVKSMVTSGRAFLLAQQQQDGSWIETTRPPGNVSYAQRISTTGWATLALLATGRPLARHGADPKR